MTENEFLRLALKLHETSTTADPWQPFLAKYTGVVGADMSVLQVHDLTGRCSRILTSFDLSSACRDSYNSHYSRLNIWRDRGRRYYTASGVTLSEELCSTRDLHRSEFYNDFLLPMGGVRCMGIVFAVEQNFAPCLTALRSAAKNEFDESHRNYVRPFIPHLTRVWALRERLDMLKAAGTVLDDAAIGILFLDSEGRVVYHNRYAESILRASDGLAVQNRVLVASHPASRVHLQRLLASARCVAGGAETTGALIRRPSGQRPYRVVATPVLNGFPGGTGLPQPSAVVFVSDQEKREPVRAKLLMQLYGLTRKEAALAATLSEGMALAEAADRLGITYETARTHLRRVLGKTEVSRQADLQVLLATLPRERSGET